METNLGLILQRFLIYSYAYYILNESLVSDEEYDYLSVILLKNWDDLEHNHKHLITKYDLEAGTLFGMVDNDYPEIVKGAARWQVQQKKS